MLSLPVRGNLHTIIGLLPARRCLFPPVGACVASGVNAARDFFGGSVLFPAAFYICTYHMSSGNTKEKKKYMFVPGFGGLTVSG